jgi:hypothetical protein
MISSCSQSIVFLVKWLPLLVISRDGISAKLLKLAKPVIAKPITKMINKTITNSVFPNQLPFQVKWSFP